MNLIVRSGPDAGASIAVDRRVTIGREGDFRLTDPTVSRLHAAVTPTSDGGLLLEDLGSTGGTVVNGTRLFGPVTLRGGEQVLLGGSTLELEAPAPAPVPAPLPAPEALAAAAPGSPLAPPIVPPPPTPSPVLPPPVAPAGGGMDRKKLLIAIAVVVAILVAAAGFVLLSGGDDDAQGGGGGGGGSTGQDSATGATTLAPVANLRALPGDFAPDPATWAVTLTWDDAPAELGLDHYEVTRNGKRIAAAVAEPTFVDDGVQPGQELNYEVIAAGSGGTTEVAAATVETPELEVGDSHVTGAWIVQMRITKSNLNDIGATGQLTWDFEAGCSFGACDNTFTIRRKDLSGAMALIAGTEGEYTGVGFGFFLLDDCRGDRISEEVDVEFTVKKADVQADVWAAQTFKGSMQETAESAGCVTARRTFAITGERV